MLIDVVGRSSSKQTEVSRRRPTTLSNLRSHDLSPGVNAILKADRVFFCHVTEPTGASRNAPTLATPPRCDACSAMSMRRLLPKMCLAIVGVVFLCAATIAWINWSLSIASREVFVATELTKAGCAVVRYVDDPIRTRNLEPLAVLLGNRDVFNHIAYVDLQNAVTLQDQDALVGECRFVQCIRNWHIREPATLRTFLHLHDLELIGNQVDDRVCNIVGHLTHLERLRLESESITEKGIESLRSCNSLHSLSIGANVRDEVVHALGRLKSLRMIALLRSDVSRSTLEQFAQQRGLEAVTFVDCRFREGLKFPVEARSSLSIRLIRGTISREDLEFLKAAFVVQQDRAPLSE